MTITTAVTQTTYTIVSQYTFEELWSQAIDALYECNREEDLAEPDNCSTSFWCLKDFADEYVDDDNLELLEAIRAAFSLDFADCGYYDYYQEEMQAEDDEDREVVEFDMEVMTPLIDKFELIGKYFPTVDGGNYTLQPRSLAAAPLEYLDRIVSDYENFDIDVTEEECDEGYNITVEVGDIPSTIHSEFISHIFE